MRSARLPSITLAFLIGALAAVSHAGTQQRDILPPTQVSPVQFGFGSTTLSIDVRWPVACPCTLSLTNGAPNSTLLLPTGRVLAGWIWVDNVLVLTPIQISIARASASVVLGLAPGPHQIRLQLIGLPNSYVTVRVSGSVSVTDLAAPRAEHSANVLPDGGVLVAGGESASGVLDSTELIAGDASSTVASEPLTQVRAGHAAALVAGGATIVAGGRDASGELSAVEVRTATGSMPATSLDEGRRDHTATTLLDGRVLVLGGTTIGGAASNSALIIDPRPDPFTDGQYDAAAAPVTVMGPVLQTARSGHTATLLADGRVLVIGGRNGSVDLRSMELVDPDAGTSVALSTLLATGRSDHTATLRSNGSILVAGGRNGAALLASIEIVGAALTGVSAGGALAIARAGHSATMIRDGEILIAGGWTAVGVTPHTELAPTPPADTLTPSIVAISPGDDALDVDRAVVIGLQASEPLDPGAVSAAHIALQNNGGTPIPAVIGIADHGTLITVRPDALLLGDTYTVTLTGVTDRAGLVLPPFSFSFTTVAPPVITSITPTEGPAGTDVTVSGSGFGATAADHQLTFGTTLVPVVPVSPTALTFTVPAMAPGSYPIALRTRGGLATAPSPFVILHPVPTLSEIAPSHVAAGSAAFTLTLTGTNFVDGATVVVGTTTLPATFVSATSLQAEVPASSIAVAGVLDVHVVNPSPGGGPSNTVPLTVDSVGPTLTSVTIFPRGMSLSAGGSQQLTADARYSDGSTANVTSTASWVSSDPQVLTVSASGAASAVSEGTSSITVSFGGQSAEASVRVYSGEAIPPDPADVAPDLNPTESTTTADATRFLYEGENPIQRGVAPGTIEARRAAVIRGVVLARDGQPISGAHVAINDRPELGYTLTRLDGGYDLALNGGGSLIVRFTKTGVLSADRRIVAPPGEMVVADDVVLIGLDPQVTEIALGASAPLQIARGSTVTDDSGARNATVLFPQGTGAVMQMPDGSTQPLTTLHVRATEYTVGGSGPAAMPAALPATSAYTYAVELSVDEAMSAGATSVQFSAPVPFYVENFIGAPVGTAVPAGTYDRQLESWVPSDNGVVIGIVSIDAGHAQLDLDGDGTAEDSSTLAQHGITQAEQAALAGLFTSGQTVWRVALAHFSSVDLNYPTGTSPDADLNPSLPPPENGGTIGREAPEACGSIIECQDQVLGERLPLTGTPFTLNYRSDRVPGRIVSNDLSIHLTQADVPPSLLNVQLEVSVAGRRTRQSFSPASNQVASFSWDGMDAYGRKMSGPVPVQVQVRHVYPTLYPLQYYSQQLQQLFGVANSAELTPGQLVVPGRQTLSIPTVWHETLGGAPAESATVGGWSLDVHHVYEPASGTVLFGDGRVRTAEQRVEGWPVTAVDLPPFSYFDAVVAEDGIYFQDGQSPIVERKAPNQQPVQVATLPSQRSFAVDARRSRVLYADCSSSGALTVSIHEVVQGGSPNQLGSAALPAGEQCFDSSVKIARAPGGTVYVGYSRWLYQMLPGGPLRLIGLFPTYQEGLAVGAHGAVHRSAVVAGPGGGFVIERVESTGRLTRIAGTGAEGFSGDGGPALDADIGYPYDLAVAEDGSVLFADFGANQRTRLRRVSPSGIITTVGGGGDGFGLLVDGSPATAIPYLQHLDVGPDGDIYVFGDFAYRLPALHASTLTRVASEDASEVYEFSDTGRHLRTVHPLTGATLYTFTYDPRGNLTAVTDGDGLATTIERTADGRPSAIEAPFGQVTTVTLDAKGWLSTLVAPGNRITTLTATASGLLTAMVDANGNPFEFSYDATGRLIRDENAAGGSETLARTNLAGRDWLASRTSEMGRVRTYKTEVLPDNAQRLTITEADGTSSVQTSREDGSREIVAADGTRTEVEVAPDPRFGLQAAIPASRTVTTPSGLTMATQVERYAEYDDPEDYSSLYTYDYTTINGRTYETVFEGATRTFTSTSPAGRVTTSTIDAQGRDTRTQVGSLTPIDFTYDAQGRLSQTTQGPRQSTITYDSAGRPSVLTDALTRTVSFSYDVADRVTTQTLPDTRTIGFSYDQNSNVTTLTPPGRPAHTFTFTPIDLTSSYTPPPIAGTGSTGYLFNVDRQPTEVQRPDGQTNTFTYGATNGRLNSVTFSRGTLSYGYDTAGRVSTLADPGGVNLAFTYDGALPLSETWSGPIEGAVSRTFTNNFELATEKVNDTFQVAFGYDADRLLTGAGALTIARHPDHGLVTGTTLGTTTETHEYNTFGEPSRQTAQANSTQVFDVQITRDDLGRITQRIEVVDGITRVFEYGYDVAGRLATVRRNGTLVVLYTYDGNGNRLSAEGEAGLVTASYDDQDRLLTYGNVSHSYGANGELATRTVAGQTTGYVYDTLGNLVQVTKPNGDVITYTIDGRGRRVGKSINGTRVKGWLYADQLRPIAELDGAGDVVSRFVYGSRANVPEYLVKNGITYRIFADHLGSPRVIVDASTGAIVQRLDFHAFGEIIQDSNPGWQPFGFAGGLFDADTGLVRFGTRDYDPQIARWLAKDPIRFEGNDPNIYGYVLSDPLNVIDPTGLCPSYLDRYLQHLDKYLVDVGPAAAALLGGLWPKSLAPATGGRPPALGSDNPLTSLPRALGMPGAATALVRGGAAAIGVATVGVGMYNVGVLVSGLGYAAFPGSNGIPAGNK